MSDEVQLLGLQLAARQGDAGSQFQLGMMYTLGKGVEKDEAEAARLYAQAAERGLADARCALGYCYYMGKGAEKDEAKAVLLYA
jgi:TPR repeat protein